jgi:N6-L-threonylcarbamoyladenine synthase
LQKSIADELEDRAKNAFNQLSEEVLRNKTFVLAGGVAANLMIQNRFKTFCEARGFRLATPPLRLCTDNAAMIAWVGLGYHLQNIQHDFYFEPRPRWKLRERIYE